MWQKKSHKLHAFHSRYRHRRGFLGNPAFVTPYFIGISGGSSSGKTTFCEQMIHLLGEERVLHIRQENYYRDLAHLPSEERVQINLHSPDFVEFSLLINHLDDLFFGKTILLPKYDFSKNTRTVLPEIVLPKPIVLVEGVLLYTNEDTQKRFNHKVFIDTPEETRYQRQLLRASKEPNRLSESVAQQFHSRIMPTHNLYVEPAKSKADQIISGEASFEHEIKSLCLKILSEVGF